MGKFQFSSVEGQCGQGRLTGMPDWSSSWTLGSGRPAACPWISSAPGPVVTTVPFGSPVGDHED